MHLRLVEDVEENDPSLPRCRSGAAPPGTRGRLGEQVAEDHDQALARTIARQLMQTAGHVGVARRRQVGQERQDIAELRALGARRQAGLDARVKSIISPTGSC